MAKKIRQSVWETNSSSTHSICIAKAVNVTIPKSLHFKSGEFGWESDTLQSIREKASYLYTGLIVNNREEDFNKIVQILKDKGVDVTIEDESGDDFGYVDHSDRMTDFLNGVCEDKGKLLRFLFSDFSFVLTGNDNCDIDININVSYPHDEYYKGN